MIPKHKAKTPHSKGFKRSWRHKEVEKDTNVVELMSLLHIPAINNTFSKEFRSFNNRDKNRTELKKIVKSCESARDIYFESLFHSPYREALKKKKNQLPPLYWFEVTRYGFDDWRMSHLEPRLGPYTPHYDILPRDVITWMADALVDPDKVITVRDAYSRLLRKKVELQFVRYSDTFIFGTVRPVTGARHRTANATVPGKGKTAQARQEVKRRREKQCIEQEMACRVQHFYLDHHPHHIKPMIQKRMIKKLAQLRNNGAENGKTGL
ncbi:MAG: hypothetical protein GY940_29650 [bacterium]|nr:hypothetical protein [bacterium]